MRPAFHPSALDQTSRRERASRREPASRRLALPIAPGRLTLAMLVSALPALASPLASPPAPMTPAARPTAGPSALLPALPPGDKGLHKDERLGFQFKPPKGWTSIPLKTDEGWLVAKYLSDKSYFYTDKDIGYTMEHKPELLVIAFRRDTPKKKKKVTREEDKLDGLDVIKVTIRNPYKDYEDFLDRTYQGGGWFVDKKKEFKLNGLEVTRYDIKVEKLARSGPKRITTWIYHTVDIDFAMQIEVLETEYKKLSKVLDRSFKSFTEIERNGDILPTNDGAVSSITFYTRKKLSTGSPKERRTVRMKSQREMHDKAIAGLPEDWDHEYFGDVLVLEHNQKKWAKRLGEHLELVLDYIEKEFDYIGKGEYARAPVVRVCDTEEEAAAFERGVVSGTSGGAVWIYPGSEIVTYKDDGGFIGYEVEDVNRRLFYLWLAERDEDLLSALPEWISIGIYEYVGGARRDGRKLEFRVDQSDWDNARLNLAQGKATPLRDLVRFTREEFQSDSAGASAESYWAHRAEATMLVRFLLEKDSKRCKVAKDLLERYITTLAEVLDEVKEKENASWANEKEPQTEEEEEALAKSRAERWRAREKELMEATYERVFGDWTDKDWASFEKAYHDWLK